MYESYWGLEAKPFTDTADTDFYYPAETHQGALLKLRYAVENRRTAALLSGGAGLGKSLVVRALLRQLGEEYAPRLHVVFPQMPPDQLLAYLASSLVGASCSGPTPPVERSVRLIEQSLAENVEQGRHAVIVIDEAQVLDDCNSLETVRLLLNIEHHAVTPMTVLLAGQGALLPVLERTPELEERLSVKCLLRRLSQEDSISYIHHRLQAAGSQREIFDASALETVHRLSHGVPRRINRLCDLALLVGFAEERPIINAQQIEAVSDELVTMKAPEYGAVVT